MAELITEEQPRIKYSTHFVGPLQLPHSTSSLDSVPGATPGPAATHVLRSPQCPLAPLAHLSRLMSRMEALGAAPILNDGQVAGNCAISPALLAASDTGRDPAAASVEAASAATNPAHGSSAPASSVSAHQATAPGGCVQLAPSRGTQEGGHVRGDLDDPVPRSAAGPVTHGTAGAASSPSQPPPSMSSPPPAVEGSPLEGLALVSMSGKPPGHVLDPKSDFVLVTRFDRAAWAASYRSRGPAVRPSSDSPLLVAALAHGREYGWAELPYVVLHGHALAEGEGLSYAAGLGLPISPRATLFSTPEDLAELEDLLRSHPYPAHRCYIRRGHGFFLLGRSVAEAEQLFDELIVPWLRQQQRES